MAAFFGLALAGLGVFWVMHQPKTETITATAFEVPEVSSVVQDEPTKVVHKPAASDTNPWAESEQKAEPALAASADSEDEEAEREKKIDAAMKKVSGQRSTSRAPVPPAQKALAFLKLKKIPHSARDIEASESARRQWKFLSPSNSVPKFDIGGTAVEGFSESAIMGAIRNAAEKRVDQGRY